MKTTGTERMSESGNRLSELSAANDVRHSDLFLVSQENDEGTYDQYWSRKLTYAGLSSALVESFMAAGITSAYVPLTAVTSQLGSDRQKVTSQWLVTDQLGQLSSILVGQLNYLNQVV